MAAKHLVVLVLVVWRCFAGGMLDEIVEKFIPAVVCACCVCFFSFLIFCDEFLVVVHVCFGVHMARVLKLLHCAKTQLLILFCSIFVVYISLSNLACVGF